MVLYQLLVLLPWCLLTKVNLNFALCHSPADPSFEHIKHHYFTAAVMALNIFSFIGRNICYVILLPLSWWWSKNEDGGERKRKEEKTIENTKKNE